MGKINLYDIAIICQIAYEIDKPYINYVPSCIDEKILFKKFIDSIQFYEDKYTDAQCIILKSYDLKTMVISVRGSNSIIDWKQNINMDSFSFEDEKYHDIRFHLGFYKQAESLRKIIIGKINEFKIEGGRKIIYCGHSSGAAVCSIMAFQDNIQNIWGNNVIDSTKIYTFGSPKFTNLNGALWFEENIKYYRVVNYRDPVPTIPIFDKISGIKEEHVDKLILLFKNNKLMSNITRASQYDIECCDYIKKILSGEVNIDNHSQKKYLDLIRNNKVLYKL